MTAGVLSRFDFTAARNAVALGDRWSGSPGWLFGRLDFGFARGPNLCQIDRVSGAGEKIGTTKLKGFVSIEQPFFSIHSLNHARFFDLETWNSPWPGVEKS